MRIWLLLSFFALAPLAQAENDLDFYRALRVDAKFASRPGGDAAARLLEALIKVNEATTIKWGYPSEAAEKRGCVTWLSYQLPPVWRTAKGREIPLAPIYVLRGAVKTAMRKQAGFDWVDGTGLASAAERAVIEALGEDSQAYALWLNSPLSVFGDSSDYRAPLVQRALRAATKLTNVNRDFDIPLTAGYALDSARTVYLDRDLPMSFRVRKRTVEVTPLLTFSALVEKALLAELKLSPENFFVAREIAQRLVENALKAHEVPAREYREFLRRQQQGSRKDLQAVPADLDFAAYEAMKDQDLLARMKAVQAKSVESVEPADKEAP